VSFAVDDLAEAEKRNIHLCDSSPGNHSQKYPKYPSMYPKYPKYSQLDVQLSPCLSAFSSESHMNNNNDDSGSRSSRSSSYSSSSSGGVGGCVRSDHTARASAVHAFSLQSYLHQSFPDCRVLFVKWCGHSDQTNHGNDMISINHHNRNNYNNTAYLGPDSMFVVCSKGPVMLFTFSLSSASTRILTRYIPASNSYNNNNNHLLGNALYKSIIGFTSNSIPLYKTCAIVNTLSDGLSMLQLVQSRLANHQIIEAIRYVYFLCVFQTTRSVSTSGSVAGNAAGNTTAVMNGNNSSGTSVAAIGDAGGGGMDMDQMAFIVDRKHMVVQILQYLLKRSNLSTTYELSNKNNHNNNNNNNNNKFIILAHETFNLLFPLFSDDPTIQRLYNRHLNIILASSHPMWSLALQCLQNVPRIDVAYQIYHAASHHNNMTLISYLAPICRGNDDRVVQTLLSAKHSIQVLNSITSDTDDARMFLMAKTKKFTDAKAVKEYTDFEREQLMQQRRQTGLTFEMQGMYEQALQWYRLYHLSDCEVRLLKLLNVKTH
jgi:hypothetical protein